MIVNGEIAAALYHQLLPSGKSKVSFTWILVAPVQVHVTGVVSVAGSYTSQLPVGTGSSLLTANQIFPD